MQFDFLSHLELKLDLECKSVGQGSFACYWHWIYVNAIDIIYVEKVVLLIIGEVFVHISFLNIGVHDCVPTILRFRCGFNM